MVDNEPPGPAVSDGDSVELRLALVMNGGVSLAVWMGGVVHELNLLRLASQHLAGALPGLSQDDPDLPVFTVWLDLLRRTRRRVTVDIISGTSAGGLNGLLLATAIARGGALPDLRRLWEDSADLKSLLRREAGAKKPPTSLFNGTFFTEQIRGAVQRIGTTQQAENVTLFVTATALDGPPRQFKDGFDQRFDVRDHRRVYHFGNRKPGETPRYLPPGSPQSPSPSPVKWDFVYDPLTEFEEDEPLVVAARATASYPGAFPPVSEDPLVNRQVLPEDDCSAGASCVMDGGVLNNAPFGPVLDEIARRPIEDRPVDRILVYVVPSAGQLAEESVERTPCGDVSAVTVALNALNYPQEADFRSSTEDLDRRLKGSVRSPRDELFERLMPRNDPDEAAAAALAQQVTDAAGHLVGEYRRNRAKAVLLETLQVRVDAKAATPIATPPQLPDAAVEQVLRQPLNWLPTLDRSAPGAPGDGGDGAPDRHRAGSGGSTSPTPGTLTAPDLDRWQWGLSAAIRLLTTLGGNLNQRLVQAQRHTPRTVVSPDGAPASPGGVPASPAPPAADELQRLAKEINQCLLRVIAVRDAAQAVRQAQCAKKPLLGVAEAAELVDGIYTDLDIQATVAQQVKAGAEAFLEALHRDGARRWQSPTDVVSAFLAVEVATTACAPAVGVLAPPTPRFSFLRLGPDSTGQLFREDWERSLRDRKLFGIRFKHFGAFINRDWRRSDFTWGRLDAAHHLLPLVAPDCSADRERGLHELILRAGEGDTAGDPVTEMTDRLKRLGNPDDSKLLGTEEVDLLRDAGDTALDVLLPGQRLPRWGLRRFWNLTWRFWRPKPGEAEPRRKLGKALKCATWALATAAALLVVLLVGCGFLLGGFFAWW